MLPYRDCVVAVILNEKGLVFAGERSDRPGVWQLRQGGVDPGETAEIAVLRELREEIGTNDVEILESCQEKISYDFPPDMSAPIAKKFSGQVQQWFLLKFNEGARPDLSVSDGEFSDLGWRRPDELLKTVVSWKLDAYKTGFTAFSLLPSED